MPPSPQNLTQLEFRNLLNLCEAAVRLAGAGPSDAVLIAKSEVTQEIQDCCERYRVPEPLLWKWYRAMERPGNFVVQGIRPFWKDALAELFNDN